MELSKRLRAVADLVTPGGRLADVGTDHGYIPIALIQEGRISYAIAMDVNRGPLERARIHVQQEGLGEKIETRLSNGLEKLKSGEVNTVVIAGMGGGLTIQILEQGRLVLPSLQELILQPQSELERVRRWLEANEWDIVEEDMVQEDGKFYPMMKVKRGRMRLNTKVEARYGPRLLQGKHQCLKEYLQWEKGIREEVKNQLQKSEGENAKRRLLEVEEALWENQAAQNLLET